MRNHILFMALSVFSAQAEISRLAALSMIETGNDDHAVGGAGEVSRFQIKPWIWRQYNQSGAYTNRRISTEVAGNHLAALRDTFHKCSGRAPSDFDIYVLWNAGPTYYARIGFAKSRVHPVIRDRARRFANLCQINDATMAQASLPKVPVVPEPPAVNANAPVLATADGSQPFWPILPPMEATSLQNPMFPVLPLTSRPEVPSPGQQPLFAIGGIKTQ